MNETVNKAENMKNAALAISKILQQYGLGTLDFSIIFGEIMASSFEAANRNLFANTEVKNEN